MEQNLISAALSSEDAAVISNSITAIKEKLPFLLTLSPDERKALIKAGISNRSIIDNASEIAVQFPQIFSPLFNQQEFRRDYELYKSLGTVLSLLTTLTVSVEDTMMAAGSDAMIQALEVYAVAQASQEKVPGLKSLVDEMKLYFKKSKRTVKASDASQAPQT